MSASGFCSRSRSEARGSLLFLFVHRRRALAELDPLSMRERSDTHKKFHYLRTWWNYTILVILVTAYCGMISYNVVARLGPLWGVIVQTTLLALDTISLAALIFVVARIDKRWREERRLRSKAHEAGEFDSERDRWAYYWIDLAKLLNPVP